ncbi:MAG: hypothetical protein MMC23_009864 [Stictis urceolatum]|nr:hypothetical protein [Stictis urceolata]
MAMPAAEANANPEIIPRGCPGGGPGNACPPGLFQVSDEELYLHRSDRAKSRSASGSASLAAPSAASLKRF